MLFIKAVLLSVSTFFGLSAFAEGEQLVAAPTQKVFIPVGFDNNDNVEVILSGNFENSCYKTGPAQVKVDAQSKTITLFPQAYFYPRGFCSDVLVSYTQVVSLGTLPEGDYTVRIGNRDHLAPAKLNVKPRITESPDDFLYAPVDTVSIEKNQDTQQPTLVLSGTYPATPQGCTVLEKVLVNKTGSNVLVVQPILTVYLSDTECNAARDGSNEFKKSIPLTQTLPRGPFLIHVRVLNGSSINKLVSIRG